MCTQSEPHFDCLPDFDGGGSPRRVLCALKISVPHLKVTYMEDLACYKGWGKGRWRIAGGVGHEIILDANQPHGWSATPYSVQTSQVTET